jgi:hypothetical protein
MQRRTGSPRKGIRRMLALIAIPDVPLGLV